MEPTLFKEVTYPLSLLIAKTDIGEIGLPDIQRPFVWKPAKVRDLFDSMYKGFPVGYLLFWEANPDSYRPIGTGTKQKVPRLLIVDGQQRLVSLYAVFKEAPVVWRDYSERKISIAFRPKDQVFEVTDAAIRRDPEFIPDISQIWSGKPLFRFITEFIEILRQSRQVTEDEEKRLAYAISRLDDLRSYPFTALELSSAVDEEQIAEVFVRINSQGTTLKQADFILTLMSVFWDEGRSQLEDFCRATRQPSRGGNPSPYNHLIQPDPDQILRVAVGLGFRRARLHHVYSILRGKDMATEQFSDERRIAQFEVLKVAQSVVLDLQNWSEFLKTIMRAGFRSAKMISSNVALLYSYAMFLIGKRDFQLKSHELRSVIARWFFMTSLTGRYTGSPETVMEADFAHLRTISDSTGFVKTLDQIITDTLTEDFWNITLPNNLATTSARSPPLFAYYASLSLLDARVLFSEMRVAELLDPTLHARKSAIERHHLFPKNYLKKLGITEIRDTNQIANYALVEWSDNIDISDLSPAEYFPQYMARLSDDKIKKEMCYWHALPDGWAEMDYNDFLSVRRKAIANMIRDGFKML